MAIESIILDKMSFIKNDNFNFLLNWSNKYNYIYTSIPKAGSTSILYLLKQIELGLRIRFSHNDIHNKADSPLISPFDDLGWFRRYHSTYFWFSFVRNPYTRILSAYLDKIVGDKEMRPRKILFGITEINQKISFKEFLARLSKIPIYDMDIHFAPQSSLLGLDKSVVHYSFIGRLENFDNDLETILKLLNLPYENYLSRRGSEHSTGAVEKIHKYYTEVEISLVQNIYKTDFELLGYSKSISDVFSYPKW